MFLCLYLYMQLVLLVWPHWIFFLCLIPGIDQGFLKVMGINWTTWQFEALHATMVEEGEKYEFISWICAGFQILHEYSPFAGTPCKVLHLYKMYNFAPLWVSCNSSAWKWLLMWAGIKRCRFLPIVSHWPIAHDVHFACFAISTCRVLCCYASRILNRGC